MNRMKMPIRCLILLTTAWISGCVSSYVSRIEMSEHSGYPVKVALNITDSCQELYSFEPLEHVKQGVEQYGFQVTDQANADFLLNYRCREESGSFFGLDGGVGAVTMVFSLGLFPSYFYDEFMLEMEVEDLRGAAAQKIDFIEGYQSGKRSMLWWPALIVGGPLALMGKEIDKKDFQEGLTYTSYVLLQEAEKRYLFD